MVSPKPTFIIIQEFHSESIDSCHITYLAMQDEYTMTADEKEARDLKRAMMSDDFPEGPDGDIEARKIFVGELALDLWK